MAKKIGICVNIDCDNYKKEVEVEPGGEFECPLCHQPLKESKTSKPIPETGGGKSKLELIVGGIVVLAALGGGGYYFMKSKTDTAVAEPDTVKTSPMVVPAPAADTMKVDTPEVKEEKTTPTSTTPVVINGRGTIDLGYAIYTGDLKNGKPHGYGTLTYKSSRKIVSSKDFVANPGDTFEGEFRDGKISGLGYWKHDGNETAVKP